MDASGAPETPSPLQRGALVRLRDFGPAMQTTARLVRFSNRVIGRAPLEAWRVQILPAGPEEFRVVSPADVLTVARAAEAVECPACGAGPDRPCRGDGEFGGELAEPHSVRYQAAGVGQ